MARDINNHGNLDLFASDDTVANFFFLNKGNGHFGEIGLQAELAHRAEGRVRSGMGVDPADFNDDGRMDLCVSNSDEEFFSLPQNTNDSTFDDLAAPSGIGMPTRLVKRMGHNIFLATTTLATLARSLARDSPTICSKKIWSFVEYQEPLLRFRNPGTGSKMSL
jgi:enediyne biosynthesis protein E4